MTEAEIKKAKMKELVAIYNEHTTKPIKKFADMATATRRVMKLLHGKQVEGKCPACSKKIPKGTKLNHQRHVCSCGVEFYADTGRVYTVDKLGRSKAIEKSWKNDETKSKRSVRHFVRVKPSKGSTQEFRSVKQAFEHFDLPLNEHIKFRMELKAAGTLTRYDMKWEAIQSN